MRWLAAHAWIVFIVYDLKIKILWSYPNKPSISSFFIVNAVTSLSPKISAISLSNEFCHFQILLQDVSTYPAEACQITKWHECISVGSQLTVTMHSSSLGSQVEIHLLFGYTWEIFFIFQSRGLYCLFRIKIFTPGCIFKSPGNCVKLSVSPYRPMKRISRNSEQESRFI